MSGEKEMTGFKVIFHIDEPEKWGLVLANVTNLLNDQGKDKVTVIVLANSAAVRDYVSKEDNNSILSQVADLSEKGVTFKACRNALLGNEINEDRLPKVIEVVPAGVTELVKRQAEGYGYIKP